MKKIEDPTAPAMRAPMYQVRFSVFTKTSYLCGRRIQCRFLMILLQQSDAELLEAMRKTNPGMAESAVKKDSELYSRLKDVYVESTDPDSMGNADMRREKPDKPFPKDTSQYSYDFVPAQIRYEYNINSNL